MNNIFKIGESAIALTSSFHPLQQQRRKGKIYKIAAVSYCINCGTQRVNIGEAADSDYNTECDCGKEQDCRGLKWTYSNLFVKPSEISATEKEINKKNKEEYA